ncbi:A24 family peptidase [Allosphingosinicella indica]|uniref:Prepilin peptidase CpaA n=1 Tax=Allosphingosinicella indica TaxID=941907 RepID=A0A1X7FYU7_9SPHN|nr:prepilin peptidase [Allosphingosinicella indica]SMF61300.1 prepilin peptidase CpaA [Allosphingosinicella indica]
MNGGLADLLVAVLAAMLIVAVIGDVRERRIPNWLNGAIALAAIPFWIASGLGLAEIGIQIGAALVVFLLFAIAFRFGAMGGGDVKLLAALALWLPPLAMLELLVVMSLAGGALTIAMALRHRLARAEGKLKIPYGVAIAFGGFWLIGERYLNQFG